MSVRKHRWVTKNGEEREAWLADFSDGAGVRHVKFFKTKAAAKAHCEKVGVDKRAGIYTAPTKITVKQAAEDWIRFVKGEKREAATIAEYRNLVDRHIVPRLGATKLSSLTHARVQKFRDELLDRDNGGVVSRRLARRVLGGLKAILKDARRRGNVAQNVALDVNVELSKRDRAKLKIGVDVPTAEEIGRVLRAAPDGRARALIMVAAFAGLRASELRGLRWQDVDLRTDRAVVHVRQRADRYNKIGRPKSEAGERAVPMPNLVANTLRQWQLESTHKRDEDFVFGTRNGKSDVLSNIVRRAWLPAQIKASVVDANGKAKYGGLHCLRHFFASWCINRRKDGGLELPIKVVQGPARPRQHSNDGGSLRPSVPAQR